MKCILSMRRQRQTVQNAFFLSLCSDVVAALLALRKSQTHLRYRLLYTNDNTGSSTNALHKYSDLLYIHFNVFFCCIVAIIILRAHIATFAWTVSINALRTNIKKYCARKRWKQYSTLCVIRNLKWTKLKKINKHIKYLMCTTFMTCDSTNKRICWAVINVYVGDESIVKLFPSEYARFACV